MAPMHILVADDNESVRKIVTRALSGAGTRVSTTDNGQGALDKARQDRPDLLILDVMLPGMSGLEIIRDGVNRRGVLLKITIEEMNRIQRQPSVDGVIGADAGTDQRSL